MKARSAMASDAEKFIFVRRHPSPAEHHQQIKRAAKDAYNAYRSIFPTSCWNERDRVAFARLHEALEV